MVLTGPQIRLRLLEPSHRGLYHALYCSAEVMRSIGVPLTLEQAHLQFGRVLAHNRSARPGHRAWAVELAADSSALGLAALFRNESHAELGLMLLPSAWRRRVATRAFELLLPYAFGQMGLTRVDASCSNDDQLPVVVRLLAPFGFERAPGLRPGEVGWQLRRAVWISRRHHSWQVCS